MTEQLRQFYIRLIILWYRLTRPPRILTFGGKINSQILRAFGATVGKDVIAYAPIVLHNAFDGYENLKIGDNCVLNGNNFLDLSATITLEDGVSIGPGVTIMTHNGYNSNPFLVDRLAHTVGWKDVMIKRGVNVKAHVLIGMGVTIGEEAVVAGGSVVNKDIESRHLVAGVPARPVTELL